MRDKTPPPSGVLPNPASARLPQGVLIFNASDQVVYASGSLPALFQLRGGDALLGAGVADILRRAFGEKEEIVSQLTRWLGRPVDQLAGVMDPPLVLLTATGQRPIQASLSSLGDQFRIATFEDVTVLEARMSGLDIAHRDPLTGGGNRSLLELRVDEALASREAGQDASATILFLDLDRFKVINDTLGHATGDELLRIVCSRLQSSLRSCDTLARMGGDEFAILIPGSTEREVASSLATRIIDLIQRTYLIDGQIMNVGASIGIAVAPRDGRTREELLKNADLALYHSKAAGRGVFHFFEPAMAEKAERRRALEIDLRKALVLRQFELHYQPQIHSGSRAILGLQALLRWRHPQRGLLLPVDFITIAEEIGLAIPIGEWVLKRACRDATTWPDSVTVSVSVSPLQFLSEKLAADVERVLNSVDLPGNRLEVEVTEEILLNNGARVRETLCALRALGVRVAMDNFGTGLASLSQLVNFPFDTIKIDQSLMGAMQDDSKSRAIVLAISVLGESLGIATFASGVETSDQLLNVRSEGCNSIQGFYSSEAVPAGELAALFAPGNPTSSITV